MDESPSPDPIIELTGCNIWQQDHLALSGVTLSVNKGEFVYLVGKVGSGKTSLIKTLNAQLPLKEGKGIVAGYDLASIKQKDIPFLRRKLGIVFQDFQLLIDRTVEKNLEFVLRATGWKDKIIIKDRIIEVLTQVGMQNKTYKMPHELSGGEQQRVVIARALLNSPLLILADEPTGNLDPETGSQIVDLLQQISSGGTAVIMSTHNYSIVQTFPGRIMKCENTELVDLKNFGY